VDEWLDVDERPPTRQIGVSSRALTTDTELVPTLGAAVTRWNARPAGTKGVITVLDSRSYNEVVPVPTIEIREGSRLLIVAADWPAGTAADGIGRKVGRLTANELRPHFRTDLSVHGAAPSASTDPGTLTINGLLLEGKLTVNAGNLGGLRLEHSTLAPLSGGLSVRTSTGGAAGTRNERLNVAVVHSITGPINVADSVPHLRIEDSIVDAQTASPIPAQAIGSCAAVVVASTVFGRVVVRSLEASNCIFMRRVTVERRQTGCVRFCYLPRNSIVPRRYRCQPASDADARRVQPHFTSVVYGQPGFAQLAADTAPEILRGADDDGELGAFHFLQQTQRLGNLRASLDEYLRFGLEAGVFLAT
jgi:hypothetical protein